MQVVNEVLQPARDGIPLVEKRGYHRYLRFPSGRTFSLSDQSWPGTPYAVAVVEAWAAWLQTFPWQIAFTGTVAKPLFAGHLLREFGASANRLAQATFGRRFHRNGDVGLHWFAVAERHRSGVPHVHALLCSVPSERIDASCDLMNAQWAEKFGRSQAERIKCPEAVCHYLAKELATTGDYKWSRNLGQLARH